MDNTFDDGKSSTFGKQLMTYVMSKLPYSGLDIADMTDEINPKYKYFENTGERRSEVLAKYSVSQNHEYNNQSVGDITADKRYSQVMYANIQKDKGARVKDYRIMAAFSEVAKALDEICDEVINVDLNTNSCTELKIIGVDLSEFENDTIQKEFKKYICSKIFFIDIDNNLFLGITNQNSILNCFSFFNKLHEFLNYILM